MNKNAECSTVTDIHHEIKVKADPERIRTALGSREALEAWHGGAVSDAGGGGWRFDFVNGPTFHWRIAPDTGENDVTWCCVDGPGDSVGTEAKFTFIPQTDGRTLVEFRHSGWPHAGGNFRKCNTHWAVLLHRLRQYVETGAAAPVFN